MYTDDSRQGKFVTHQIPTALNNSTVDVHITTMANKNWFPTFDFTEERLSE